MRLYGGCVGGRVRTAAAVGNAYYGTMPIVCTHTNEGAIVALPSTVLLLFQLRHRTRMVHSTNVDANCCYSETQQNCGLQLFSKPLCVVVVINCDKFTLTAASSMRTRSVSSYQCVCRRVCNVCCQKVCQRFVQVLFFTCLYVCVYVCT